MGFIDLIVGGSSNRSRSKIVQLPWLQSEAANMSEEAAGDTRVSSPLPWEEDTGCEECDELLSPLTDEEETLVSEFRCLSILLMNNGVI